MAILLLVLSAVDLKLESKIDLSASYDIYDDKTRFAISDTGVLAILDMGEKQLILRDRESSLRLGRPGKGPGEFSRLETVLWNQKEAVFLVFDKGNGRLSSWRTNGEMVAETRLETLGNPRDFQMTSETGFFYSDSFEGPKFDQHHLYVQSGPGGPGKQFWTFQFPDSWRPSNLRPGEARPFIVLMHWDVELQYGVGSDFVAVWSGNQNVALLDLQGEALGAKITLTMPRYPVTDTQFDHMLMGMQNEKTRERIRKFAVRPDHWPAVKKMVVDDRDRIWVFGFPKTVGGTHHFQVFNRNAELLGEGEAVDVAWLVRGNRLYSIHKDQEDRCFIEIYQAVFANR